jgi:hypothetical protein
LECVLPFCSESFAFKILPVLYWCETLSLALREEYRLWVFENRVLRIIFGLKREMWQEAGEDYVTRNFITCIFHKILLG